MSDFEYDAWEPQPEVVDDTIDTIDDPRYRIDECGNVYEEEEVEEEADGFSVRGPNAGWGSEYDRDPEDHCGGYGDDWEDR